MKASSDATSRRWHYLHQRTSTQIRQTSSPKSPVKHYQPNCGKTLSPRYHSMWSQVYSKQQRFTIGPSWRKSYAPLAKRPTSIPAHPVLPRKKWTHTSTALVLHHCQILVRLVCTALCWEKLCPIPRRFYELPRHLTLDQLHHWQQPNHIHIAYTYIARGTHQRLNPLLQPRAHTLCFKHQTNSKTPSYQIIKENLNKRKWKSSNWISYRNIY